MKKIILATLALLLISTSVDAKKRKEMQANEDTNTFVYDVEYIKPSGEGMVLVKVWSYNKRSDVATEQGRKNAVHGVLFKGMSSSGENGTINQKPLIKDPSVFTTKADYFESFFAEGGDFNKYVSAAIDGGTEIRKIKREYKVGVTVTVSKDMLRKDLERAGVLRSLSSGF